ncbi:TauD/TfdA family dioxygenase [Flavivirga eckloniae]|uniref:Taurine catabolism dioxygenase TauD n=1 Tax=Flavivirga eckloniae TaxID=1803846 RepID=A0A2K9PT62_9FLAO|nr:TauD/TfdA family dioxygenase [Flavivirga eckloniae]AUP80252.1 taurine catabolism dioxygenase TauD [Flavivirga eckloniae]
MNNQTENLDTKSLERLLLDESISASFIKKSLSFPLVIINNDENQQLADWILDNEEDFNSNLQKYGAILCRDFKVETVEKFQSLTEMFPNDFLDYNILSSPRYEVTNNVYVSTACPEDQSIGMHSESSYALNHPNRIVFCCIIPPKVKGETPIADNRLIIKNMSPDLVKKFLNLGVMYKRNLTGFLSKSWEDVFQTSDRKKVEKQCELNGMSYNWKSDSHLELTWTKKGVWKHPETGDITWFNHALFFNKYSLNKDLLSFITSDNELPSNTFFGDGTEITKEEIEHIKEAYKKATIEFRWKKDDVLFLDNMLMSHGRNPYQGERKIVVSIS